MKVCRFAGCFINVDLTLIDYRQPPKPDYYELVLFLLLFLLRFTITELRYGREAASNTPSTFLKHFHNINHILGLYKFKCANIEVGMAV